MTKTASEALTPSLTEKLILLRDNIEHEAQAILAQYCPDMACLYQSKSTKNLGHYLAMRRHDLREIQDELSEIGVSSLGRSEAHVMHTLTQVIEILQHGYRTTPGDKPTHTGPRYHEGRHLLQENAAHLFGPETNHKTRIMVTMPTEVATDQRLAHSLIEHGMNCARINCAHDDQHTWGRMVENILKAKQKTGKECAILMDLAGQKIRTQLQPGVPHLRLFLDEPLLLARQHAGVPDDVKSVICSHPQILDTLRPEQNIWFDDGKLGTIVDSIDERGAWLHVVQSRPKGVKLRADKGINFPDSHIQLPCLTEKDLSDLDFICRHADMVGFSFVQSGDDMRTLISELEKRNAAHLAIIAKIETQVAVRNLPEIILSAVTNHRLGVMIARGDLAVELGGVRMAEIQEELLWLCEAAHVPVIWATQVLETLAKKGISSRPELTDAAMSGRAECVMLNKGPYILNAVSTLNSILKRMQDHQHKKRSRLRALSW